MDSSVLLPLLQEHLLTIFVTAITLFLIYHYLREKDSGSKLSRKYRNSLFESQAKIYLNTIRHLIAGKKDLAIREIRHAVEMHKDSLETSFVLGELFRTNGEFDKAISVHRSLIAGENISETLRLEGLKQLAIDFDKGGFVDRALETYKDVLKINPDQSDVLLSLCRIYENTEDWDKAYQYRVLLSKVTQENQSETISHVLVQRAKGYFISGQDEKCAEDLQDAFRYAPTVSAKILNLKLFLIQGRLEAARVLLMDVLRESPAYTVFLFSSLEEFPAHRERQQNYKDSLEKLKEFFLSWDEGEVLGSPAVIFSKIRILNSLGRWEESHKVLSYWLNRSRINNEALEAEFILLLIELGKKDLALERTQELMKKMNKALARYFCAQCGFNSDEVFWRCPQCFRWETIDFRWKV